MWTDLFAVWICRQVGLKVSISCSDISFLVHSPQAGDRAVLVSVCTVREESEM